MLIRTYWLYNSITMYYYITDELCTCTMMAHPQKSLRICLAIVIFVTLTFFDLIGMYYYGFDLLRILATWCIASLLGTWVWYLVFEALRPVYLIMFRLSAEDIDY